MHLYLIRHAQSTNNALADPSDRVTDPLLTEIGHRQLEELACYLSGNASRDPIWHPTALDGTRREERKITRLYCSPMRRALLTADAVGKSLGLVPHVWIDIHEEGGMWLDHGAPLGIQGKPGITRQDLLAEFPHFVVPDEITPNGWWNKEAETKAETWARAQRVAATLTEWRSSEDHIAIVTHGAFSTYLLRALQGQPADWRGSYHHENTAISLVWFRPDGWISLRYLNRVEHLPTELITA